MAKLKQRHTWLGKTIHDFKAKLLKGEERVYELGEDGWHT